VRGLGPDRPGDGRGNLAGFTRLAHWNVPGDAVSAAGVSGCRVDGGSDCPGSHRVDADLVSGEFLGQADGEGLDRRF
jgi:hypothetical protein